MDVELDEWELSRIRPLMERYCTHHGLDHPILALIPFIAGHDGFNYSDEYIESTIISTVRSYAINEVSDTGSDEYHVIYNRILEHLNHKFRKRTFTDSDFSIKSSINCLYRLITNKDTTVDLDTFPEITPDGISINPNDINRVARHVFLAIAIANKLNEQEYEVDLNTTCYFYSNYDEFVIQGYI